MLLKRFLPLILALALLTQSAAAALPHPITPETPSLGVADRQTDGQETLTQSPPGQASWQVLTSTDQGLRLAFTSPAPELRDLETPQGFFTQVFAPGLENVQMLGHPDLPGFSFIVAAPALAEVELSVSSTNSQRIDLPPGQTIAPVPGFAGLQEPGDPTHIQIEQTFDQPGVYQPATEIYTQVQHYPQELAQVVEDGWLRNLRILRIQVYPYQYAATQGSLLWHPDITLRIDFHPPPSSLLPDRENNIAPQYQPAPIEPAFASLYQQIINYPQAQHWISRPLPNQTTSASTSLGPRLSMAVVSDGIYQLDYAELIAAQPGLAQADPAYFQMYNQGDPVAIWVEGQDDGSFDPGDRVIFYGQAFDGQRLAERYASENTNWRLYLQQQTSGAYTYWKPQFNALMIEKYVQENIYYLTVSGTPGLRMQAINGDPSSNPTNPVPYYLETVRREETNWWWSNDFTSEEVFFWDQLAGNKPFTRTYTSTLSAVYTGTVNAQNSQPVAATVRAEIVAYAQSSAIAPPYDHHVSFSINDQLLFETDPYASGTPGEDLQIWEGRSRFKLATETPASNLLNGQNDFQVGVFTDGALATPNFFFDWFEIEYPRQFEAIDNQIIFARPQIPASQTYPIDIQAFLPFLALNACEPANTKFQVAGFDDLQDPFVLNITNPLQPIRVLNPAPTGDQITFSVPAGLCDKFVVAAATGIKTTQALGAYQPPDLYTAANSVDYMIIAHSDFITATQRLADWRADQGLLTRVLAIDDLYHEFGDGLPHPIAIKNFLAYALEYWAVPPSYVVLVGDGHWNIQNYATYKWGDVPNFMPPNLAYVDPYQGEVDATNLLATARGTDPLADVHLG
ncbi:MAG: hypothetical protein JW862_09605, partial [Anaerolineales bacterium]|nr:hypothetical protein [Anaerolineales bacterium]